MNEEQIKELAKTIGNKIRNLSASDLVLTLANLQVYNSDLMPAMLGVIWATGGQMNADKAVIKKTQTGIQLSFVAKRGGSLILPGQKKGV